MTTRSATSSTLAIQKLFEFLKISGRLEPSPGFSTVLGVNLESMNRSQFMYDPGVVGKQLSESPVLTIRNFPVIKAVSSENSQTFRKNHHLVLPPLLVPPPLDEQQQSTKENHLAPSVSLSTFMALIDDFTTWALLLGDNKRNRPGKSATLWAERVHDSQSFHPEARVSQVGNSEEIDVVATVLKIGNNLGFVEAQVFDSVSKRMLCRSSHIKYLPLGRVWDFVLSDPYWNVTQQYLDYFTKTPPTVLEGSMPSFSEVFESLEFVSPNAAKFRVSPVHASLGGPIHGGCQGILMELVAAPIARRDFLTELSRRDSTQGEVAPATVNTRLDSINVHYVSPPSKHEVSIIVDAVCIESAEAVASSSVEGSAVSSITYRVQIFSPGNKLNSVGTLRFSLER
jgi:hypothetical protein